MEIPVVETERLILREWRAEDLDAYAAMNTDPDVRRFMYPARPLSRAEAAAEIAVEEERWATLGVGHRPVILKETVGVPEVISIAHPDNHVSHRVMEKIGLERAAAFRWEARELDVVYYRSPSGT